MKKIISLAILMLVLVTACSETPTGNTVATGSGAEFTLEVDIPCPGHAQLILNELYTVDGVTNVDSKYPNLYDITYDPSTTSEDEIKDLEIFNEYPCKVV
tara:strand:+ start:234 stop:533 length:300 start_codon:yes stop_codon:yes gene_type:complete